MKFCHYCYNEITAHRFIAKNDGTKFYHLVCFARLKGMVLKGKKLSKTMKEVSNENRNMEYL